MSEKNKMLSSQEYYSADIKLVEERTNAHHICRQYNNGPELNKKKLFNLFGSHGSNLYIEAPFYCDYGYNIKLGDNVYFNFNCVILDCAKVSIEDNVKFGPNVQLYTAGHPIDPESRKMGLEYAKPISIGKNTWVGGGAIILPGVTIGQNVIIGAGSIVTKSIPDSSIYAGNPAKSIKRITNHST